MYGLVQSCNALDKLLVNVVDIVVKLDEPVTLTPLVKFVGVGVGVGLSRGYG